jgi:hypothetical protein
VILELAPELRAYIGPVLGLIDASALEIDRPAVVCIKHYQRTRKLAA